MGWRRKARPRPWVTVPLEVPGTMHVRLAAAGLVELSLRNIQPGVTGTIDLGMLPVGYRPSRPFDVQATSGTLRARQDGTVSLVSISQATAWQYISHTYSTDEEVA